jgi:hypothetical protein
VTRHALSVVEGTRPPSLRRTAARPRLRPGEYPIWCELDLSHSEQALLRRRAHQNGVGVDAFVGVSLEYLLLADAIGNECVVSLVAAAAESERPALSSAPELRGWQRLLEGRAGPPADELPSICVAMRLLSEVPVPLRMEKLQAATTISDAEASAALLLETIAVRHSLTMGGWALRQLAAGVG